MRPQLLLLCLASLLGCDDKATPRPDAPQPTVVATDAGSAGKVSAARVSGPKLYEHVLLSPVYKVDKIYKSMRGPHHTDDVALAVGLSSGSDEPELLWVVGFEATMVDKTGDKAMSQEFMCHTNLDMDASQHRELFGAAKQITGRLFTLSQGQYRIDMPKGYGIPILSSELVSVNTQVLNLNMKEGKAEVRHRVVMRYHRDTELKQPMKALYAAGAYGLKLLEGKDGHYGRAHDKASAEQSGEQSAEHGDQHTACLPGSNASNNSFDDGAGRTFTGHWVVEPGREKNHTRVTELMDLPFDTTLHYVAVHLHPFAETLELKDLTTGTTVYKAKTRQTDKGIGLAHVDFLSSEKGVPLYKDHEYELVSVYENTSGEAQDSMAVMNLYLLDKEFKKPDLSQVKAKIEQLKKGEAAQPAPVGSAPKSSHHHKPGAM
jgi:hypothetical protein